VEELVGREQAHPVLQVPVVLVVEGPRRHQDRSWAAKLEFRPRGSGSCHHQKKKKAGMRSRVRDGASATTIYATN
jgi:hypothetical protein